MPTLLLLADTLHTFESIQIVLGAILAIVGVLVAFKKYVVNPIMNAIKKVSLLLVKVDEISKIIQPNGGSSVLDKLSRIEKAQIVIENKHKLLSLVLGVAMFETDKNGNYIWVSSEWSKYTGMAQEETLNNDWLTGVHEDDRDMVHEEWSKCLIQKREFFCRFRLKHTATGKVLPVKCTTLLLKDFSGNIIGILGVLSRDKI